MKNRELRVIWVLIVTLAFTFSNSTQAETTYHGETYAGRGFLVGGLAAGGLLTAVAASGAFCDDEYCVTTGRALGTFGIGFILGGLVGAGIGSAIPKKSGVQFSVLLSPEKNNFTAGGSLEINF